MQALTGPTSQEIAAVISNLVCGTQYQFRARASNAAGTTLGDTIIFSTPSCGGLPAPTGLVATAVTTSRVDVSCNASAGATQYELLRASAPGGYATLIATSMTTYSDFSIAADQAYVYKVRAISPTSSPFSTPDAATTIFFTDDPLIATATAIKATHISEIRESANALRAAAGLGVSTFTDPVLTTSVVAKAIHLSEVRTALSRARVALGLPSGSYTDATLIAGTTVIKADHVQELRSLLK